MCYKFTEKTDIHKEDRKKEKTALVNSSSQNEFRVLFSPGNSTQSRNSYTEPQYSGVKLSDTNSKDIKEPYTSVIFPCFLGASLISYSFWSISHMEQILNAGRSRRNHSRVWRK